MTHDRDPIRGEETFLHAAFDDADEREARAQELDAVGRTKQANRVRACLDPRSPCPGWCCHLRACTTCAQAIAAENARRMCKAIPQMGNPVAVLLTMRSENLWDLGPAITACRAALANLRRLACFRGVRGGVGGFEVKLSEGGTCWVFHGHLVLDIDPTCFNVADVERAWSRLTESRGTFEFHRGADHDEKVDRCSPYAIARYFTKSRDWCPKPGDLSPKHLDLLWTALRSRRLFTSWGTGKQADERRGDGAMDPASKRATNAGGARTSGGGRTFRSIAFRLEDDPGDDLSQYRYVRETLDKLVAHSVGHTTGEVLELLCLALRNDHDYFTILDTPDTLLRQVQHLLGVRLTARDPTGRVVFGDPDSESMVSGFAATHGDSKSDTARTEWESGR